MSHKYDGHKFESPQEALANGLCPECEQPVTEATAKKHARDHWPNAIPDGPASAEARERQRLLQNYKAAKK